MHEFSHYAGFIGEAKDRYAMTFGAEPRRLSIVGKLKGDGGLPAVDVDLSVAIREGTSSEDAIELLTQVIAEVHGLPKSSAEALELSHHVMASLTKALAAIHDREAPATNDNVVPLHPQA